MDCGALVDEDESTESEPETSVDQEYVTTETGADSFADLFSEEGLDTEEDSEPVDGLEAEESEPEVTVDTESNEPVVEPAASESEPEVKLVSELSPVSELENEPDDPVFKPDKVDDEVFFEPNEPVDSRGRGTYDPFA